MVTPPPALVALFVLERSFLTLLHPSKTAFYFSPICPYCKIHFASKPAARLATKSAQFLKNLQKMPSLVGVKWGHGGRAYIMKNLLTTAIVGSGQSKFFMAVADRLKDRLICIDNHSHCSVAAFPRNFTKGSCLADGFWFLICPSFFIFKCFCISFYIVPSPWNWDGWSGSFCAKATNPPISIFSPVPTQKNSRSAFFSFTTSICETPNIIWNIFFFTFFW